MICDLPVNSTTIDHDLHICDFDRFQRLAPESDDIKCYKMSPLDSNSLYYKKIEEKKSPSESREDNQKQRTRSNDWYLLGISHTYYNVEKMTSLIPINGSRGELRGTCKQPGERQRKDIEGTCCDYKGLYGTHDWWFYNFTLLLSYYLRHHRHLIYLFPRLIIQRDPPQHRQEPRRSWEEWQDVRYVQRSKITKQNEDQKLVRKFMVIWYDHGVDDEQNVASQLTLSTVSFSCVALTISYEPFSRRKSRPHRVVQSNRRVSTCVSRSAWSGSRVLVGGRNWSAGGKRSWSYSDKQTHDTNMRMGLVGDVRKVTHVKIEFFWPC